jgi:hypothetical protein
MPGNKGECLPETIPSSVKVLAQRPINRYGVLDSTPLAIRAGEKAAVADLAKQLQVSVAIAERILEISRTVIRPVYALADASEVSAEIRDRAVRQMVFSHDSRVVINDAAPAAGRIMSERPFALRVHFAASKLHPPRLASVEVEWQGESFVVEQLISELELEKGYVDVEFGEGQTLPTGAATFHIKVFNESGQGAKFRVTCAVLPSNPFSLNLGPDGQFVTGTWSARGVRNGNAYDTDIAVTLSNGDGAAVAMQSGFVWKFWGSGVGSYIVEQGNGDFGVPINVPAFGTWGGWISFNSPQGSGIFGFYDSKKDMTVEIQMTRADGGVVSGSITARTMFKFGVNITAVAGEDFTNQEWADLDLAAGVTKTIYERRDMTFDTDDRFIPLANVGPYEIITSFDEFHNLLSDWSGPNTNNNIDAFIVQAIMIGNTGADGIDGSVPGPTSHDGSDSGVVAAKSGFVDASGNKRLNSAYLGMLIGHELGHYLGLEHTNDAGNLMLPSSGTTDTNLEYNQYKIMIQHGWVAID